MTDMMTDPLTDSEILEDIAARREVGLNKALEIHGPSVLGIARRVLCDVSTAEEVAQDTFMILWNDARRVDLAKGNLRSFLLGVARHKAIDRVRGNEARKRATERDRLDRSTDADSHEAILQRVDLDPALKRLTKLQHQALMLAYFGGLTYREVAQELGIPEGTAKSRLRDGLNALRQHLTAPPTGAA